MVYAKGLNNPRYNLAALQLSHLRTMMNGKRRRIAKDEAMNFKSILPLIGGNSRNCGQFRVESRQQSTVTRTYHSSRRGLIARFAWDRYTCFVPVQGKLARAHAYYIIPRRDARGNFIGLKHRPMKINPPVQLPAGNYRITLRGNAEEPPIETSGHHSLSLAILQ